MAKVTNVLSRSNRRWRVALCHWEGCQTDIPLRGGKISERTGHKLPTYQRKYCPTHLPMALSRNGSLGAREKVLALGEESIDSVGYVRVKTATGIEKKHRVVMERVLGRPLVRGVESVHHINGVRTDNRPGNLELWVGGIRYGQRATEIQCPHCGRFYLEKEGS